MRRVKPVDVRPDNMVYLRKEITQVVTDTMNRFFIQAVKTLYDSVGEIDSYYDFCFAQYDEAMEATHAIPEREAELLLGRDRKTHSIRLMIFTPAEEKNITNRGGNFGKGHYPPAQLGLLNPSKMTVVLQLLLPKQRFGRGLKGTAGGTGSPIILSPGMDNYEVLMQSAAALTHVRSKLALYRPLTSYILGVVGTTGKLRTVWPQIMPFLPPESKAALSDRVRKAWPAQLLRGMEHAGWTQETMSKALANIAANVVHASMLPSTSIDDVESDNNDRIIGRTFGSFPVDKRPRIFGKPPNFPNYKSTL